MPTNTPISPTLTHPRRLEHRRPREQEHRVDGEDDVEIGEDVVADVHLRPALADRVDADS